MGPGEAERIEAKRLRNKRDHAASRASYDHVLLRLDKGGAAALDAAAGQAGLGRSAFARLYLAPLASAIAPHAGAVGRASRERGQSVERFLRRAIEAALAQPAEPAAESPAASEFDRLFGPED